MVQEELLKKWKEVSNLEEKYLFLVGKPGLGKSKIMRELSEKKGWERISLKELFPRKFIEILSEERPKKALELILAELEDKKIEVILLDEVEMLFLPIFNLKPMELIKKLSEKYPLIISWRGTYDNEKLYLEYQGKFDYFELSMKNNTKVFTL